MRTCVRFAAIIPLGRDLHHGSSSLPEGFQFRSAYANLNWSAFRINRNTNSSSRAGSPLLFGLAPRGVFRASFVAKRAVGSYPTVSPLPRNQLSRRLAGFPTRCHRAPFHRRFIFCGTFREPHRTHDVRRSTPDVIRRVAHRFPTLRPETSVSGLSSRPRLAARTSDHPAHPLHQV